MKNLKQKCKIALVQAEPVMFDKKASLTKVINYIDQTAAEQPDLIVFQSYLFPAIPSE